MLEYTEIKTWKRARGSVPVTLLPRKKRGQPIAIRT